MYARVLRKCSLAKFLMNLWLVVIMLLVICCQNASTMHLVKNSRASIPSSSSLNAPVNKSSRDFNLDHTMTIYNPYDRFLNPNQSPLHKSQRAKYVRHNQDERDFRQDQVQQQQQLISPYTVFIQTNADTTQLDDHVPNINSQIINLNSNNYGSSSDFVSEDSMGSFVSQQKSSKNMGQLEHHTLTNSQIITYFNDRKRHMPILVQRPQIKHERTDSRQTDFHEISAKSPVSVLSSQAQASKSSLQPSSQPLTFDPFRPAPNWLQLENDRRERIKRHRQRRHRHFEQIARMDPSSEKEKFDHKNSNNSSKSNPFSTLTTTFSNNTDSKSRNNTNNSLSNKNYTPQGGVQNASVLISKSQDNVTANHSANNHYYRRQRLSRSHHPRRRPKRYCSARDPVQLAYLAPIVVEGKVRSMSTNRRGNFSVSFQITQIFKNRQNHNVGKLDLVRLQFNFLNTTGECDIYQEQFRERGLIKRDLQIGRNYTLFLKYIGEKFWVLGQPILSNQRVYNYVKNASQEKFGKTASIKQLTANRQNKVREKEELRIVCRVRGNPPPKITWFKDDKSIKQSRQLYQFINLKRRSELIVKSFSNATAGLYECRAKNMVSKRVEKKTIRIEAYGRPESHNDTGEDCITSMKAFCLNGGICRFFSDISQYYCKCAEGFEGDRCEEKRPTNVALSMYPSSICGRSTYYGQSKC